MLVFLEAVIKRPEEERGEAIPSAILSSHEKSGLNILAQLPSVLSPEYLKDKAITGELEGTPIPEKNIDFDQLAHFNTYGLKAIDYPQRADTQKIGEALKNSTSFTVIEISNPQWEENSKLADAAYESGSPDFEKLEKRFKRTPKKIFIIKNEKTGETEVSIHKPSFISDGKLGYETGSGNFTYDGKKLPNGQTRFSTEIVEGRSIGNFASDYFSKNCNITLVKPSDADMDKYESVKRGDKTFYVKKSAELARKDMSEGIMK